MESNWAERLKRSAFRFAKRKISRSKLLTAPPATSTIRFTGAMCTIAFQEAPVTTSVEVLRGGCAFGDFIRC